MVSAHKNDNPNNSSTFLAVVDKPHHQSKIRKPVIMLFSQTYRNPGLHFANPDILYLASFLTSDLCRAFAADWFLHLIFHNTEALNLTNARVEPVASYNLNIIAYHHQELDTAYLASSVLFDNFEATD